MTQHPPLSTQLKEDLACVAGTIRQLSMEAVQKADSGHPGLPMGCAEIGAYLYGVLLRHYPKDPHYLNRDRFILSAGHGSMLLYSCLHLAGFDLTLDDIKQFRQLHSKTPGHPESTDTAGVETTTGPLGQGVGHAVGTALGLKLMEARLNDAEISLLSGKVYCLAGDGCIMEGVSSEVSSLAGHLQLDNLVLIYDSNKICLDGPLSECCSENTRERYLAYGWHVLEMDGNDLEDIHQTFQKANALKGKPVLVIAHTTIGKGSPHKAGSSKAHGSPLGQEEIDLTKQALGLPKESFFVSDRVKKYFQNHLQEQKTAYDQWQQLKSRWSAASPQKAQLLKECLEKKLPTDLESALSTLPLAPSVSGRKASNDLLQILGQKLPYLYGGSADLSCSDLTMMPSLGIVGPGHFNARNIKYGVREFGMATMAAGLYQSQMIQPYIGTFLTFSDYMRNAIRLSAMMRLPVIYQFTHDSVFLGEDGPTHQPVEHYAALRAIPRLHVIRPADAREVRGAWLAALHYQGPTALLLSRQNLPLLPGTERPFNEGVARGAYILRKEKSKADFILLATGSEVSLACQAADLLEAQGKSVRVVSFPCWELFDQQDQAWKESVLGGSGRRVSIESGVSFGWERYIGLDGISISIEDFGASAPMKDLQQYFGFTPEAIVSRLNRA